MSTITSLRAPQLIRVAVNRLATSARPKAARRVDATRAPTSSLRSGSAPIGLSDRATRVARTRPITNDHSSTSNPALDPFFRRFSTARSPYSTSKMASSQSVITLILADHRQAEADFAAYEQATDKATRERIARKLIAEISQHGAQEEMSIYPWMKQKDAEAAKKIDHSLEEHLQLKKDLHKLDSLDVDDSEFKSTLAKCWADLSHHIKEEESDVLPKLQKLATEAELAQLGQKFQDLKSIAPTHPHPMAPASGGPMTQAANAGAAMVDKARDAMAGKMA